MPCFLPPPIINVSIPADTTEHKVTRSVLHEPNQNYQSNYHHSFIDSALKVGKSLGIERKKSEVEKRKNKRKLKWEFCRAVNQQFAKNAGVAFLAENESFRGYQRKRLSQSFELKQPGKIKSHVPSESTISCYRDAVLEKTFTVA